MPTRSVRLVVFNLDQQKELFRQESFSPKALDQVAQAINNVQLGVVDYRVLQNRRGHLDRMRHPGFPFARRHLDQDAADRFFRLSGEPGSAR